MRYRLTEIDAMLAELRRQREAVRQDIVNEQARLVADAAKAQEGIILSVRAPWEQNMTVPEIAHALGRSPGAVERALADAREAGGVTVRRGREVPERRRVRDAHGQPAKLTNCENCAAKPPGASAWP
jgi:predicted transcriptional regulator